MTIKQIKEDLKDIKFYYSKQQDIEKAAKVVGPCEMQEKVERYNKAVCKAPAKLYSLYIALYVNNNTQLVVSRDWDYSPDYIRHLNDKLCAFLLEQLG